MTRISWITILTTIAITLIALPASAEVTTSSILPDVYIVELAPDNEPQSLTDISDSVDVLATYEHIDAVAISATPAELEQLQDAGDIVSVTPVRRYEILLNDTVPLTNTDDVHASPTSITGAGTAVAILDTGVQSDHPMFTNDGTTDSRVMYEACFSNISELGESICPSITTTPDGTTTEPGSAAPCTTPSGSCGHGTHVAGIAAGNTATIAGQTVTGMAPGANIIAVQVFTRDIGSGSLFTTDIELMAAYEYLDYLADSGVSIGAVNMSLGTTSVYATHAECDALYGPIDGFDGPGLFTSIANLLSEHNIPTIVANGNSGSTAGISGPACLSNVVSVGATDKSDSIAGYSNNNELTSVYAPGSSILSAIPTSILGTKSGTSMAAPHVAGLFTLLRSIAPTTATASHIVDAVTTSGISVTDTRSATPVTKNRIDTVSALTALNTILASAPTVDWDLGTSNTLPLSASVTITDDIEIDPTTPTITDAPGNTIADLVCTQDSRTTHTCTFTALQPGIVSVTVSDQAGLSTTSEINLATILGISNTDATIITSGTLPDISTTPIYTTSTVLSGDNQSLISSIPTVLSDINDNYWYISSNNIIIDDTTINEDIILVSGSIGSPTALVHLPASTTLPSVGTFGPVTLGGSPNISRFTPRATINITTPSEPFTITGGLLEICLPNATATFGSNTGSLTIYTSTDGSNWTLESPTNLHITSADTLCWQTNHASWFTVGTQRTSSGGGGGGGGGSAKPKTTPVIMTPTLSVLQTQQLLAQSSVAQLCVQSNRATPLRIRQTLRTAQLLPATKKYFSNKLVNTTLHKLFTTAGYAVVTPKRIVQSPVITAKTYCNTVTPLQTSSL